MGLWRKKKTVANTEEKAAERKTTAFNSFDRMQVMEAHTKKPEDLKQFVLFQQLAKCKTN